MTRTNSPLTRSTKIGIAGGLIATLLIIGFSIFATFNSVRNGIIEREQNLNAQYADNQQALGQYTLKVKESLGVADRASDKLDKVIVDAVQGRYGDKGANNGTMMSAIVEAYPDLKGMNVNYERVQTTIESGRTGFENKQRLLLDKIRDYETYRQQGIFHSMFASWLGAPTQNLTATVSDVSVHGPDALAKMKQVITSSDATRAYEKGVDEGINTNPSQAPNTTPTAQPTKKK